MAFFSTDIELLPSSRFDAGADKWNKIYLDMKKEMIGKYGSAGKSPRTGNNMPAVPYAVAVAISVQFAVELGNLIVRFIGQNDDPLLAPQDFVGSDNTVSTALINSRFQLPHYLKTWEYWLELSHDNVGKRTQLAQRWLASSVCRANYNTNPNFLELNQVAVVRNLDANWRAVEFGGDIICVGTRQDVDPERHWLRPAVRAYQRLILERHDPVGPPHRGQAVSDHERRPVAHQVRQRFLDQPFRLGVERRGGFIEDQDGRVFQERPRDRQALPLAAREALAALPYRALVAAWQRHDELVGVRGPCCVFDLLARCVG